MCRSCYRELIDFLDNFLQSWSGCCSDCINLGEKYEQLQAILKSLDFVHNREDFDQIIQSTYDKMHDIFELTETQSQYKGENVLLQNGVVLRQINNLLHNIVTHVGTWELKENKSMNK